MVWANKIMILTHQHVAMTRWHLSSRSHEAQGRDEPVVPAKSEPVREHEQIDIFRGCIESDKQDEDVKSTKMRTSGPTKT